MISFGIFVFVGTQWELVANRETEENAIALAEATAKRTTQQVGIKRNYPDPSYIYRVWN